MTACRNCGEETSANVRFCPSCGKAVETDRGGRAAPESATRLGVEVSAEAARPPVAFEHRALDELAGYVGPVTKRLLASHAGQTPTVYAINMGDHLIGAVIPQLACEAVGGRSSDSVDLACAYSLGLIAGRICDDMMDRTIERSGRRTVWREFGDPVAIPLGFQLISEMFETLSAYDATIGRVDSDRIARTFRTALVASARAEEQEKLSRRAKTNLSFEAGVEIARGKRGALIAAGTTTGAIVGKGTEEEIQILRDYGTFMGTANQLFDDSSDPDYSDSYRTRALSESRDLTSEAVKCTDRLKMTEARRKLRDLCKISEVPLL